MLALPALLAAAIAGATSTAAPTPAAAPDEPFLARYAATRTGRSFSISVTNAFASPNNISVLSM